MLTKGSKNNRKKSSGEQRNYFRVMQLKDKINKNEISNVLHIGYDLIEVKSKLDNTKAEGSSYKNSDYITNNENTSKIISSSFSSETFSDVSYNTSDDDSNAVKNNSGQLKRKIKHDQESDDFSSEISSSYSSGGTHTKCHDTSSICSREKYFKLYSQKYGKVSQETNSHHKKDSTIHNRSISSDDSSPFVSSSSSDKTGVIPSLSSYESRKERDYVLRGLSNKEVENEGFFYDFSDCCSSDSKKENKNHTKYYTIDDLYKKTFEISSQKSSSQRCPVVSFGVTFKPLKNATYRLFVCGTILELGNALFPEDVVGKRVELFSDPDNEDRPYFWRTEPICIESCVPGTSIRYSYYIQADKSLEKRTESKMISETTPNVKELGKGCNLLSFRSFILPKPYLRGTCTKEQVNKRRHFYVLDKEYKLTNVKPQITYFNDIHESSSNSSLSF